jgi:Spo0E like sporulation regulatory protein
MPSTSELQNIMYEMEKKRSELQSFALVNGFTHPVTLRLSEELDELFNLYTAQAAKNDE